MLGVLVFLVLAVGFFVAAVIVVSVSIDAGYFGRPLCTSAACVDEYVKSIAPALYIARTTIELVVAMATVGGIFVALLSYFNSSSNAALANHIGHLKIFMEYLDSEIAKRDRLSAALIDSLLLYSVIFDRSRDGKTTVSAEFKLLVQGLNAIISESNERAVVGTPGGFSYKEHQRKMRDHLKAAGFTMYLAPRNDYFEMERQLFSLIDRMNQSFCATGSVPPILRVEYY